MKIKITKSPNDWFETEGHRIVLTLPNGNEVIIVEPIFERDFIHITMDGQMVIHPTASNSCDLSIRENS